MYQCNVVCTSVLYHSLYVCTSVFVPKLYLPVCNSCCRYLLVLKVLVLYVPVYDDFQT